LGFLFSLFAVDEPAANTSQGNKFDNNMENATTTTAKHYKTAGKQYKTNKVNNTRRATAAAAAAAAAATATTAATATAVTPAATSTKKQTYRETATATTVTKRTTSKANIAAATEATSAPLNASKAAAAAATDVASSNSNSNSNSNSKPSTSTRDKLSELPLPTVDNSNHIISNNNNNNTNNNNNNNNHHSDNSISENNYEFKCRDKANLSDSKMTLQQMAAVSSNQEPVAPNVANTSIIGSQQTTVNATPATDEAPLGDWSNISRYLHKKFKRLASTTEVESGNATNGGGGAHHQPSGDAIRTTSLSSNSSLSPPPAPLANGHHHHLMTQQQNHQQVQQQQQHQHQPPPPPAATHEFSANFVNSNHVNAIGQEESLIISSSSSSNSGYKAAARTRTPLSNSNTNSNSNYAANATLSPATFAQHQQVTQPTTASPGVVVANPVGEKSGRYVCTYCNLICAKPSVLEKHIRAHTNERPYPCDTCGIAFKTKSNLYKHCRSRSHAARARGLEVPADADDGLSDQDAELSNSSSELVSRTNQIPIETLANFLIYCSQVALDRPTTSP